MTRPHAPAASTAAILEAIVGTVTGEGDWDTVLRGIAVATQARAAMIELREGDHVAWKARHGAGRGADAQRPGAVLVVNTALGTTREVRLTLIAPHPAGAARLLAATLLPSLCTAVLAARRESGKASAPHAHAEAVARKAALPYLAVDSRLCVVHASADARALFDHHSLLRLESGFLRASDARIARLRQLIVTALREQRSVADCLVSHDRKQFLAVRGSPFHGDIQQWQSTAPLALLLLNPERAAPTPGLLRDRIGLSTAEAELLASLARGQSIGEIAIERKRSGETLRSQLKAMFAKTATHTQSELVALALFANLLPMF